MDYDVIDDTRPRLQLKSGPASSHSEERHVNKVQVGICCSIGVALLGFGWTLIAPLQFISMWLGLSMIVGPLAPLSLTGGDCRVGEGEPIPPVEVSEELPEAANSRADFKYAPRKGAFEVSRDAKTVKDVEETVGGNGPRPSGAPKGETANTNNSRKGATEADDKEFTHEEVEWLRKLLIKHPRGTMKRWEVIAEAMGGKHSADNVVKMAKALGERKFTDQDSYTKFLSQRKGSDVAIASPLSQRYEGENGTDLQDDNGAVGEITANEPDGSGKGLWSDREDKALVTALKTFSKDTVMRWDKVASAIPGKTKAQCLKRFSELRRNFRSSKADGEVE
ncbi:protein MpRR-MYB3 [Marchantia polymorpha subsp. ruderalis]|uniref:Myb-like domain-containing protein n=1 Tax=Marchantia polymorpha TaxID=3197 RepID=A0A2R6X1S8_MARPO|nr:hypothetical protein MARPO_0042s0072 [Marchantia polymorpha]BBN02337.1 hypothetical protein Mp_2g14450 [Marchantia polymorpha subsp. ruderalis]|eukprot:PTQ40036.1 hypothetical protein MARPO_0042s0072 [Marchantia polymorpha]